MKRTVLSILVAAPLVVGCASKGQDYGETLDTYEDQGIAFSADIEESSEGWRFENVQRGTSGEVKLDDLYPVDLEYSGRCATGFWGLTEGFCGAPKFGESEVTMGHIVASPITVPLQQVFTLIFAPIIELEDSYQHSFLEHPDVLILPLSANQEFDWNEYWNAVEEAKASDDFYERFINSYHDFTKLEEEIKNYSQPNWTKSNEDEILKDARNAYRSEKNQRKQHAKENLKIKVVDDSGLIAASGFNETNIEPSLNGMENNRLLNEFQNNLQHKPDPDLVNISPQLISGAEFRDIGEMEKAINETKYRYREKKSRNSEIASSYNDKTRTFNKSNKETLNDFKEEINLNTFLFSSNHEIKAKNKFSDFNLSFDDEDHVEVKSDGTVENSEKRVFVDSLDLNHSFNPTIAKSDGVIDIRLSDNILNIKNTTDEFVTIDSISLYHDGNIQTRSGDAFSNLELFPPRSQNTESLRQAFDSDGLTVVEYDLIAEEARQTYYNYGVVIQYRVSGEDGERVMDETRDLNLLSLIEQELYPDQ